MSIIPRFLIRKCFNHPPNYLSSFHQRNYSTNNNNKSDEKNILYSDLSDVDIPKTTIHEYLLPRFDKWPNHVAKECLVTGRKYTYDDMRIKSRNFSRQIRKRFKLNKGDVMAVLLPNVPEFTLVCFGAFQAGIIVTTINPIYSTGEIAKQLQDSSAKLLITLEDLWDTAKQSTEINQKRIPILTLKTEPNQPLSDGAIDLFEFLNEPIDYPDVTSIQPDDVALMLYSSGTTGLPKGVEITHTNAVTNFDLFQHEKLRVHENATNDFQDVLIAVLPNFHIYGLSACGFLPLYNGSKALCLPQFDPNLYIKFIKEYKPSVLHVVPPLLMFITSHPAITVNDLRSVQTVISGAAPLGLLDEEKMKDKAQRDIYIFQGYGLTEASPMVSISRRDLKDAGLDLGGSVGRLIPNTSAKIINPDDPKGTPLGPNTVGELLIKGPQIMKGYFKKPKETREAFLDGWLRSGDMAYYNNDQILYITDRLKELIKVKGFQVAPAELEEIIRHFPGVADAAVIGIPHETDGEVPRAYVIAKDEQEIDCEKLSEFVASQVAPFKQLRGGISVVDDIPKSLAGKILRRKLKIGYENETKK